MEFLTMTEAHELSAYAPNGPIPLSTIQRACYNGKLPAVKPGREWGSQWAIKAADFAKWANGWTPGGGRRPRRGMEK